MKNIFKSFFFVLVTFLATFAQDGAKPKYQGFDAGFVKFGGMQAGYREFELRVDYDPFHFVAKGLVYAGPQTTDLDILGDKLTAAVSYFDAGFKDAKGNRQVVSLADVAFLVDDERAKVKDVSFDLLPPLNTAQGKAGLKASADYFASYSAAYSADARSAEEEKTLTHAFADPMNKANREHEIKAKSDALAKAHQDSIAQAQAVQAAKAASIKAKQDSAAAATAAAQAPKPKKKKVVVVEEEPAPVVAPAPVDNTATEVAPVSEEQSAAVAAPAPDDDQPVAPVKKKKKKKIHSDGSAAVNADGSPSDSQGFMGSGGNRQKLGIGMAILGGIFAVYGIIEQNTVNDRLKKIQAIEGVPNFLPTYQSMLLPQYGNKSYNDLSNEKKGAETNRNVALVLAALSIGGSIVMFRF